MEAVDPCFSICLTGIQPPKYGNTLPHFFGAVLNERSPMCRILSKTSIVERMPTWRRHILPTRIRDREFTLPARLVSHSPPPPLAHSRLNPSPQNPLHHLAMHVRQTIISPLETINQLRVIEAQAMQ